MLMSATLLVASIASMFTLLVSGSTNSNEQLYFSFIVSGASTLNTSGVASSVDKALELVGNATKVFSGYSLRYSQVLDAQVSL